MTSENYLMNEVNKLDIEVFNFMPEHSRVWIYQCERFLAPHEVIAVNEEGDRFVAGWSAHGAPLTAKIAIVENLFLIVMVDELQAKATGCSIDKSVAFVKEVEDYLGASLTNRMKVALEVNNQIVVSDLNKLSELKANKVISENTLAYDNLVDTKTKLFSNWKTKIGESWHAQFL